MSDIYLSIVLNHASSFGRIKKTIRHIARQTALHDLELILVSNASNASDLDISELNQIPNWKQVVLPKVPYGAIGWAAGINASAGQAVVLAEDHSFPEPRWAEVLIQRQKQGFHIVAPRVLNGNPGTLVSWANFQLTFIEFYLPQASGEAERGPGHNSSYDKKALLSMDGDLATWLVSEWVLHEAMKARGYRIFLDVDIATHHVNLSKLGALFRHSFYGGRIIGSERSKSWPLPRRLFQAAAFPLVPLLRTYRLLKWLNRKEARSEVRFLEAFPFTLAALVCHAAGEAAGYLFGEGQVMAIYQAFEISRIDYVIDQELNLLLEDFVA